MRFYIIVVLLAMVQTSALVGIFHSFLYTPNITYAFLFLELLKEEPQSVKKPIFAGFFLDLMYDSLGLHISGSLLLMELIAFLRSRYEFPNYMALLTAYSVVALIVRAFLFFLFRLKFYMPFDFLLFSLGFVVELFVFYIFCRLQKA